MDSSSDEGKVFVGGIGWDTTEEKLKDHFTHYGDVTHVMIMRDRITAQPRGFAFVVFSDPSVIPSVLQQTHSIDGRTVEAKKAMSREQQQSLKSGNGNFGRFENIKTKKIFVGGLPSTISEDGFKEHFQEYGNVTDVVIMYDPNTNRPRGFGFITFTTEDSVDRVLQKTFHELDGKLVEVKRALPKDAAFSSNSRGGYKGYNSYNSSVRMSNSPNRFMQSPQITSGGYPPYSGYGTSSYGYGVGSNVGYNAYGGYGVSGYGNTNYTPAGVYGTPGSPVTNFSKNQWRGQASGYGSSGYGQTASYGSSSTPWSNAPGGGSPSGASQYGNRGYNSGGTEYTSPAYAGGAAAAANAGQHNGGGNNTGRTYVRSNGSSGHPDASWKSEA
ncbi:hypothetical protein RD792_009510 [Penstemon davidsonii]|uniref:RRM domain-containing protein n=1 Tax=Penstemon davidsonii TaxID=160366 RepID=A0ABR0CZH9_9LAMI|nr:hypothetical protein RD792_009510 [Penstemon davidsonii]